MRGRKPSPSSNKPAKTWRRKTELEEKLERNSKRCCTNRSPAGQLEAARNERQKTISGWNLHSAGPASNSLASYGRTNPACAIALRVPKRQQKPAPGLDEASRGRAVRNRQQEATRKGTTYKTFEVNAHSMARTGGLGAPSRSGLLAGSWHDAASHGEQLQGGLLKDGHQRIEGTEVKAARWARHPSIAGLWRLVSILPVKAIWVWARWSACFLASASRSY